METPENVINITVLIAGRPYPLKIKAQDETSVRTLVKDINDKFNRFQQAYTKKDKQDILAMLLLTYAVDLHKSRNPTSEDTISEQLSQLDSVLSHILQ